jgi:hypothetical protein
MNGPEMVVLIVAVVMTAQVLKARYRMRDCGDDTAIAPVADSAETRMLRDEVKQLRDRIQVLERVITDNHSASDLDREIERLRNK